MNITSSILVVAGEPNSVFIELYIKSLKKIKVKNPLILIASYKLIQLQMKKLNLKKNIKIIDPKKIFGVYLYAKPTICSISINYLPFQLGFLFDKKASRASFLSSDSITIE